MKLGGHDLIQHQYFRMKYTELNEIYAVMSLRTFAVSLIGIFVPIYLYKIGYSLAWIFSLFALLYLIELGLEYLATVSVTKIGPKHSVALSMPFLVIYLFVLWTIPNFNWPMIVIAFFGAASLVLFWQGYNFDFSKIKHKNSVTREISKDYIFIAIASALAPFIGGFVASNFGTGYVFGLSTVLLVMACVPLFITSEKYYPNYTIDFAKVKLSEIKKEIISYGGNAVEYSAGSVAWPFFMFLIVGSYQGVGAITTVGLLVTILVLYLIGKKADKKERCKYIRTGSFLNSLIYFAKILANSFSQIISLNVIGGAAHSIFHSPLISEYYLHADEESRAEYIFMMESATDLARVFYFGFLAIIALYFPVLTVLIVGLALGAIGSLLIGLMPPSKREINFNNVAIKNIPRPARR